jgi:diguanylate cyclase (GGDEF)-like protein
MRERAERAFAESQGGASRFFFSSTSINSSAVTTDMAHEAGDRVLVEFAAVMRRCLREGDIAGRWGGEEFLVLLDDASFSDARDIVAALREQAGSIAVDRAPDFVVRFSGGAVEIGMTEDVEAAVHMADMLLYEAKRSGRDRICYANPRWSSLATDLRLERYTSSNGVRPLERGIL